MSDLPGTFRRFARQLQTVGSVRSSRQREIFPLAPVIPDQLRPVNMISLHWKIIVRFGRAVITALNFLYNVNPAIGVPSAHNAAQLDVVARVVSRTCDLAQRLQELLQGTWEHLLPDWVQHVDRPQGPRYGDLSADRVDVLEHSGLCSALECLPEEVQKVVQDPNQLFAEAPADLNCFESFSTGEQAEYVKLVCRQLRSGKIGLASSVRGGGTVLCVGKPGTQRQREVWHGQRVSQAAIPPPKPRHLASPTALLYLGASPENPQRVSKRDARCWFDQLVLPGALRTWMGRPPVTVTDLTTTGGVSKKDIQSHLISSFDGEISSDSALFPVSLVWPMGFCWSSFVAQEKLLNLCQAAGLSEEQVLSCDAATPCS